MNRYRVVVTRRALGATSAVSWYSDGIIGMQGPIFWRPTARWAKRRADRHVARRLRKHAREEAAERYTVAS